MEDDLACVATLSHMVAGVIAENASEASHQEESRPMMLRTLGNVPSVPVFPEVTYKYFAGRMITGPGGYVATDRLGSVRANQAGDRFRCLPYGEEPAPTADGREKFGTYTRDSSTGAGQDYAMARYYSAVWGRFWSPDPAGMAAADPGDPGSLNRYAYVNGDPVNSNDPTGLELQREFEPGVWSDYHGYSDYIQHGGGGGFGAGCIVDGMEVPCWYGLGVLESGAAVPFSGPDIIQTTAGWVKIKVDLFGAVTLDLLSSLVGGEPKSQGCEVSSTMNFGHGRISTGPATVTFYALDGRVLSQGSLELQLAAMPSFRSMAGPLSNWLRVDESYSYSLGQHISKSIKWGASPAKNGKYLQQIGNGTLRSLNQWLRARRVPFSGWRGADPGHFHLKK